MLFNSFKLLFRRKELDFGEKTWAEELNMVYEAWSVNN
jgi:hypothetical protein